MSEWYICAVAGIAFGLSVSNFIMLLILQGENRKLQRQIKGHCDRIAAQSELLSRAALRETRQLTEIAKTPVASLDYLIEVAQKTEGAEIWRALFAEMRKAANQQ